MHRHTVSLHTGPLYALQPFLQLLLYMRFELRLFARCGRNVSDRGGERTAVEVGSMVLSEQDFGRTVNVRMGEVVTVRLQENPTTGYRWAVETASGLEQTGDHFEAGGAVGAAG